VRFKPHDDLNEEFFQSSGINGGMLLSLDEGAFSELFQRDLKQLLPEAPLSIY